MRSIKLKAVIEERYKLHLKLPEGLKVGLAEVIVILEDDSDSSESPQKSSALTTQRGRQFGQFRGLIQIADDFDTPLPKAFWLEEN